VKSGDWVWANSLELQLGCSRISCLPRFGPGGNSAGSLKSDPLPPLSGPLIRRTDELSAMSMEINGTPIDDAAVLATQVVQHGRVEISSRCLGCAPLRCCRSYCSHTVLIQKDCVNRLAD